MDIRATAPVRICDVGGWTDTWFAHVGAVCHLAVEPGVTVMVSPTDATNAASTVHLSAPDLGENYHFGPPADGDWSTFVPRRQPLLEHTIASVLERRPDAGPIEVTIRSAVPAGASLGTSAAVLVALVSALETFGAGPAPSTLDRGRIATDAHRIETIRAGRESGVQDHWAAAFGGAQLLRIDPYPRVDVQPISIDTSFRAAIDTQVVTVIFGPHDSSAVHAQVIAALEADGSASRVIRSHLDRLGRLASSAAEALDTADLPRWAAVLREATDMQARLHPGLVGVAHRAAIESAALHDALGWKVNGAGGDGGSLSVVFASSDGADGFRSHLASRFPLWVVPDLRLADGLAVSIG